MSQTTESRADVDSDVKRFVFPHHVTQAHDASVHAVEDMDDEQRADLSDVFDRLDREADLKGTNRPGTPKWDDDDQLRIRDVPTEDRSRRVWAILRNVEGATGGGAELAIAELPAAERVMDVLRRRRVTNYTYKVSDRLIRGSRPSPQKLADLFHHNRVRSTVNLCREMHHGDDEIIDAAKLTGRIRTLHIPVIDNGVPDYEHILQFFRFLLDADNLPAYVHCEQGVGRTGVMVACYRMGFNGWTTEAAKREAQDFKNSMPMQLAFIEQTRATLTGEGGDTMADVFAKSGFPVKEAPDSPPEPRITLDQCIDRPVVPIDPGSDMQPGDGSDRNQ